MDSMLSRKARAYSTLMLKTLLHSFQGTDYGLPERAFFFKNLELLGLGRHFGLKCFEVFEVSAPILTL